MLWKLNINFLFLKYRFWNSVVKATTEHTCNPSTSEGEKDQELKVIQG